MFPQKSIRISAKCIHLVTLVDILIHLDIWDPPPLFTNGNLLYVSSNFDSIKKTLLQNLFTFYLLLYVYMGQFPLDGENGQNVEFFFELCCDLTV